MIPMFINQVAAKWKKKKKCLCVCVCVYMCVRVREWFPGMVRVLFFKIYGNSRFFVHFQHRKNMSFKSVAIKSNGYKRERV